MKRIKFRFKFRKEWTRGNNMLRKEKDLFRRSDLTLKYLNLNKILKFFLIFLSYYSESFVLKFERKEILLILT